MKKSLIVLVAAAAALSLFVWASPDSDVKGVEAAVLDYVEGIYNVEPARIERSVHRDLWKRGFYRRDGEWRLAPMNYEQLHRLSGRWNKDGKQANDKSPKEIVVFDVLDKTASAKLTAQWGVDYFHLAKVDGKWQIMNVIWQSPPAEE